MIRLSNAAQYTKDFSPPPRLAADLNTLALYHCDEGQGNVLHDSSDNKRHGRIVGAKWVAAGGDTQLPSSK